MKKKAFRNSLNVHAAIRAKHSLKNGQAKGRRPAMSLVLLHPSLAAFEVHYYIYIESFLVIVHHPLYSQQTEYAHSRTIADRCGAGGARVRPTTPKILFPAAAVSLCVECGVVLLCLTTT